MNKQENLLLNAIDPSAAPFGEFKLIATNDDESKLLNRLSRLLDRCTIQDLCFSLEMLTAGASNFGFISDLAAKSRLFVEIDGKSRIDFSAPVPAIVQVGLILKPDLERLRESMRYSFEEKQ